MRRCLTAAFGESALRTEANSNDSIADGHVPACGWGFVGAGVLSKADRLIANPAACCARHAGSIESTSADDLPAERAVHS
jgi:hypothetical protein